MMLHARKFRHLPNVIPGQKPLTTVEIFLDFQDILSKFQLYQCNRLTVYIDLKHLLNYQYGDLPKYMRSRLRADTKNYLHFEFVFIFFDLFS